jgi:hypothetical protein
MRPVFLKPVSRNYYAKKAPHRISAFGGYDHRPVIQDGAWYDEQNLSSDQYPLLTVRRNRVQDQSEDWAQEGGIVAFCAADTLVVLTRDGFLHAGGHRKMICEEITGNTPRSMVRMGAWVVVFPDRLYCNVIKLAAGDQLVEGEDYGEIDNHFAIVGEEESDPNLCPRVKLSLCDVEGKKYPNVVFGHDAPQSTTSTWVEINESGVHVRIYSSTTWTEIPTVYVRVAADGISDGLRAGDGVKLRFYITPWDMLSNHDWFLDKLLNSSQVIIKTGSDNIEGDYIVITGVFEPASQQDQEAEMTGVTGWSYEAGSETFIIRDYPTQLSNTWKYLYIDREAPEMDFVVECENRLWGCFCGEKDGEHLNEIYASKLGDFRNWNVFQGVATDSYSASRGADGAFTGAAVLDGHPLFFREKCVEKVFPSAAGAHQIQTQTLDGVQQGSWRSLVVIDDRLYYKGTGGVYVYTGTLPQLISPQFGEVIYSEGVAGSGGKKYYIAMRTRAAADRPYEWRLFCFDTESGIWHREDAPWGSNEDLGMFVCWRSRLWWIAGEQLWVADGGGDRRGVRWFCESGPMGLSETDRKFVSRISLRYRLELGAAVTVQIQYDESGRWQTVKRLGGTKLHAGTLAIWPRRCDTFRLRLEGVGGFVLYSIGWERERGSDV